MRPRLIPELICSDLDLSLQFYRGLLGFQILYARPEERFAFLHREGAELMLEQPHTQDRLWPKADLTKPFGRGVNFEIQVSNVDELHSAIVGAGMECLKRSGIDAMSARLESASLRYKILMVILFAYHKT
jgi:lactoylglutathione lyase